MKTKKKLAVTILTTIVVLFLGFGILLYGAAFYRQSQMVDFDRYRTISKTIQQAKQVDARWNEDVLKLSLSLNKTYGPLINTLLILKEFESRLQNYLDKNMLVDPDLKKHLAAYRVAAMEKTWLTDEFKNQHTVLIDSLRFIPTAMQELLQALKQAKKQPDKFQILNDLENQSRVVLQSLSRLDVEAQKSLLIFLELASARLEKSKSEFPQTVTQHLEIALAYTRKVLRQKQIADELLVRVVGIATSQNIDKLQNSFTSLYEHNLQQHNYYLALFIAYIALVIIVMVAGYLHRRSQRPIATLSAANKELEQRVEERAQELKRAYDDLAQSQVRLMQAEKMSSLGQMVAGVAHEINTPLAYSRGYFDVIEELMPAIQELVAEAAQQSELLSRGDSEGQQLQIQMQKVAQLGAKLKQDALVNEINELSHAGANGLDQIVEMVANLKNFSRVDRRKVDNVNLNDSLDSTLMIAKSELSDAIEVVKQYGELPAISCMPSSINQVFLNLLVNAAQAIDEKGAITLTTRYRNSDQVQVIIEDTGCGIPEDIQAKIFDPFFTTKEIGNGTGLGLSIVYDIIQQHNGEIKVTSKPGKGTRFTINLPIAEQQKMAQAA